MSRADHELIADCLAGNTHAFGCLVERYQDRLYNALVGVLGSVDDARDVAQDAFVHAFRKLHTYKGEAAFYSWLFRIALNAAVSLKRKQPRRTVSMNHAVAAADDDYTTYDPADLHPASEPTFALEAGERQAQVRAALAQLPDEYRTVLVLKEIDGLKYEQIAATLGCPVGTVRSRIHRARMELRDRLRILLKAHLER